MNAKTLLDFFKHEHEKQKARFDKLSARVTGECMSPGDRLSLSVELVKVQGTVEHLGSIIALAEGFILTHRDTGEP